LDTELNTYLLLPRRISIPIPRGTLIPIISQEGFQYQEGYEFKLISHFTQLANN